MLMRSLLLIFSKEEKINFPERINATRFKFVHLLLGLTLKS